MPLEGFKFCENVSNVWNYLRNRPTSANMIVWLDSPSIFLRAPAWENWESCDSDYFRTLFIFCLKIPFGKLYSKIIILRSSVFLFSEKIRKFENAAKVRLPPNGIPQITRKDEAFVKPRNFINYLGDLSNAMIWVRNNTHKHTHTHEVIQTRSKKLRISKLKNNES